MRLIHYCVTLILCHWSKSVTLMELHWHKTRIMQWEIRPKCIIWLFFHFLFPCICVPKVSWFSIILSLRSVVAILSWQDHENINSRERKKTTKLESAFVIRVLNNIQRTAQQQQTCDSAFSKCLWNGWLETTSVLTAASWTGTKCQTSRYTHMNKMIRRSFMNKTGAIPYNGLMG